MSFLRIQNLHKTFERVVAVDRISLDIKEGEFFTLLGSSGLRQDHDLKNGRGFGATRWRVHLSGRSVLGFFREKSFHQAGKAQHGDGVSVLRAVAAHDGI